MGDFAQPKATHYATLGVRPDASTEEIERAFKAQLSPFVARPMGSMSLASVAYMTLRDPAKRRAYDRSIGLGPPPVVRPPTVGYSDGRIVLAPGRIGPRRDGGLKVQAQARDVPLPPVVEDAPFMSAAAPATAAQEEVEQRLVEPAPSVAETSVAPERRVDLDRALRAAIVPTEEHALVEPTDWRRGAAILGGAALFVGAIGAWAGMQSIADGGAASAEARIELPPPTTAVPKTVAKPEFYAAPATPVSADSPPHAVKTLSRLAAKTVRVKPTPSAAAPDKTSVAELATNMLADAPADGVAAAAPAAMPLSDRLVASTIRKIGYPCGSVASKSADAEAGVFTVTCTSGHSYRATPVNGRYRFRKAG